MLKSYHQAREGCEARTGGIWMVAEGSEFTLVVCPRGIRTLEIRDVLIFKE